MPAPPSTVLVGEARPHWTPSEVSGCPFGTLVCAICPGEAPEAVYRSLEAGERHYAQTFKSNARRSEWIGGRLCLAHAIARFSAERPAMLPEATGAPIVPKGIAGSISHKGPLMLAIAAQTLGRVGIDVECVNEHDTQLGRKILTPRERARLGERSGFAAAQYVVAHFALKEAIYKALSPLEQSGIEFEEIELELPPLTSGTWLQPATKLLRPRSIIKSALLLDGEWVIAAAFRRHDPYRVSDN